MRIAIFTDSYVPDKNGVSASIDQFTKLMAADGHKIMIFCPKYGLYKDKRYPNITIKRYAAFKWPTYGDIRIAIPFIGAAVRDLREFGPDLVHVQTPITIGWIGIWASKILKIKNIQTYHTYIPDFLSYLNPKLLFGIKKISSEENASKMSKLVAGSSLGDDKALFARIKSYFEKDSADKAVKAKKTKKKTKKRINDTFGRDFTCVVYDRADLILTPSKAMAKILKQQGVKAKVEVQSNGIDYDFFKKKEDYGVKNHIVHFGRLGHEKSVDVVIRAFSIAQRTIPELTLDIWGDGPARKVLQLLVSSLGLNNKIRFYGRYEINKLAGELPKYDFFATASTIETQGIVILEAMASGLPVLGVDKFAISEVVHDGENGYISRPFDIEGMAANMVKLLQDDKKLERFGQKALEMAKSHEIKKCKEQLLNTYERVVSGRI